MNFSKKKKLRLQNNARFYYMKKRALMYLVIKRHLILSCINKQTKKIKKSTCYIVKLPQWQLFPWIHACKDSRYIFVSNNELRVRHMYSSSIFRPNNVILWLCLSHVQIHSHLERRAEMVCSMHYAFTLETIIKVTIFSFNRYAHCGNYDMSWHLCSH